MRVETAIEIRPPWKMGKLDDSLTVTNASKLSRGDAYERERLLCSYAGQEQP